MAGTYNFEFYAGIKQRFYVELKNGDGSAYDLTGASGTAKVKRSAGDPRVVTSLTVGIDGDPTGGRLYVEVSAAGSAGIQFDPVLDAAGLKGVWDLILTLADTSSLVLLQGKVTVFKAVSA